MKSIIIALLALLALFAAVHTPAPVTHKYESVIQSAGFNTTTIDTTEPKITLAKWNNEVAMGVALQGMKATGVSVGSNEEWTQGNQKMQAIPLSPQSGMEDGGTELNVVLAKKPTTNTWNFAISGAETLNFYLQQPLWKEKGLFAPTKLCSDTVCKIDIGTSTRPENVVGSYAVYYNNHRDHVLGKTNYATGKAFHIYRPLVTDSVGSTTWGVLSYSKGILSLTVPQSFLDTATYPVTVDPTFGYTTIGGTAIGLDNTTPGIASLNMTYTAVANDTVTAFNFNANCTVSGSGTVTEAVYTFAGGVPVTQLATPITQTVNSVTEQWWVTTVNQNLVAGTSYTVAFGNDAAGTCTSLQVFKDTLTGTQNSQNAAGALPATWTQTTTSASAYSIYATVTNGSTAKVQINGKTLIMGQTQLN